MSVNHRLTRITAVAAASLAMAGASGAALAGTAAAKTPTSGPTVTAKAYHSEIVARRNIRLARTH